MHPQMGHELAEKARMYARAERDAEILRLKDEGRLARAYERRLQEAELMKAIKLPTCRSGRLNAASSLPRAPYRTSRSV